LLPPLDTKAVGTSADNELAESFNTTFKCEVLMDQRTWPDEVTCRRQSFKWLTRYNTVRRHSHCGYLPPTTYEKQTQTTMLATAA
jgi:putative transposase